MSLILLLHFFHKFIVTLHSKTNASTKPIDSKIKAKEKKKKNSVHFALYIVLILLKQSQTGSF